MFSVTLLPQPFWSVFKWENLWEHIPIDCTRLCDNAQKLQQVRAKPGVVNVCELLAGLNMRNDHDIKAAGHMQAAWKQSYV